MKKRVFQYDLKNNPDFDTELGKEIIQVIRDLAKYGVIANYRMGYDIEYKKEEKWIIFKLRQKSKKNAA